MRSFDNARFEAAVKARKEAVGESPKYDDTGKASSHIHVREYVAPNWFTTRGVLLKRRQIELRGIPSLKEWRFLTLTLDPSKFQGPLDGYLKGKKRIRRWLEACRKERLWKDSARWAWKMEFHKSGWPHWHVLVDRTKKFTKEELVRIEELWTLGDTSCEMVREDDFLYSFKYAFKPVRIDGDELDSMSWTVPPWFLDYTGFKLVRVKNPDGSTELVQKPETFQRVRFWQTSTRFYTGIKPDRKERKEQKTWTVPQPVRVAAERASSSVQVVCRKHSGKYRKSAVVILTVLAAQIWHLAAWHAVGGNATFLSVNSAVIPAHIINQNTEQKWKLKLLQQDNRLTLRRAERLQQRAQTLRRC